MQHKIYKRTFTAKQYAKDSEKRKELNESSITSEYLPSYKYSLITNDDDKVISELTFKTEKEALGRIRLWDSVTEWGTS